MVDAPRTFPDWHALYREQPVETMPWFHPELDDDLANELAARGLTRGRVLDVGTGPGTQAIELAARGFEVTAIDLSADAVTRAAERAAARGVAVRFAHDDVLALRLTERFDAAFDRGCFHVLPVESRGAYARAIAGRLEPGALLFLKVFSAQEPGDGGPHRFTVDLVRASLEPWLELESARESVYQGQRVPLPRALFCVLRRRDAARG